jgi:myo-inositol-1(or 4)-monophosphatase
MNNYLAAATTAARKAGNLLREQLPGKRTVSFKGHVNLVTEMDRKSERCIVEVLRAAFPQHGILAEEETDIRNASGYTWIVDPLDGTTNYAHGYPCFSVSIALECRGEIIIGVVYDPMRDELFSAVKGGGSQLNGRSIAVSSVDSLIRSLLATGFPYDRTVSERNNMAYFHELLMASQEVRRDGSAALDLCSVACGRFDGFWELKLKPWDVAAGSLIVTEAGGVVSNFCGGRLDLYGDEILASNGKIHDFMIEQLRSAHERRTGEPKNPEGNTVECR